MTNYVVMTILFCSVDKSVVIATAAAMYQGATNTLMSLLMKAG